MIAIAAAIVEVLMVRVEVVRCRSERECKNAAVLLLLSLRCCTHVLNSDVGFLSISRGFIL